MTFAVLLAAIQFAAIFGVRHCIYVHRDRRFEGAVPPSVWFFTCVVTKQHITFQNATNLMYFLDPNILNF